ncbi:MAG: prepilin-type N-terminal cleavage/methylation domain-containing protein [Planctomycetaceae bacterium]
MRQLSNRINQQTPSRSAFTLVEMLVSVALVLMLMTMFATIFQITTGSMMTQRGISENDQRARILSTVVRKDLQHRTFRYPLAFYPDESSATSPTSFSNRAGYIYISTNDPNTGLDDLIQFTVSANILSEDPDATPYFGRAAALWDLSLNPKYTNGPADSRRGSLSTHINQPETDDGTFSANSTGRSAYAEISYFIRRGSLYRRVSLIREPLNVAGRDLGPQPTSAFGVDFFNGAAFSLSDPLSGTTTFLESTNDFPLHFDYSAVKPLGPGVFGARFIGSGALSNEAENAAGVVLGAPNLRLGFNRDTGRSREHTVVPGAGLGPTIFLGRFTQGETSTLNFNFPQAATRTQDDTAVLGNGNPLDIVNTPLALNSGNGVVSEFDGPRGRGGERTAEDLLLANVHEMKIELWDERLQRFVTPGHLDGNLVTGEVGDYHLSRCHNPLSGPIRGVNPGATFDTWHPKSAAFDSDDEDHFLWASKSALHRVSDLSTTQHRHTARSNSWDYVNRSVCIVLAIKYDISIVSDTARVST